MFKIQQRLDQKWAFEETKSIIPASWGNGNHHESKITAIKSRN